MILLGNGTKSGWYMLKVIIITVILHISLFAAELPKTFVQLAKAIERDATQPYEKIEACSTLPYEALRECKKEVFDTGFALDNAIVSNDDSRSALKTAYLKGLRHCQNLSEHLKRLYATSIKECIVNDNRAQLAKLMQIDLEVRPSLRQEMLDYYEHIRKNFRIDLLERMRHDAAIEKQSREELAEEYAAYQENLRVLEKSELERMLRQSTPSRRKNVYVSSEKTAEGYQLFARNDNTFRVTLTLGFQRLDNLTSDCKQPCRFELPAKSELPVANLMFQNRYEPFSYHATYGWVMGSMNARADGTLYKLPFKKGSDVRVSQGFFGAMSHKNKHAVDFAVPVGTPIYAARGGVVVSTEERYNTGGFEKRFGSTANYVIIEHEDKTLGYYYHLKQRGVAVSVGNTVATGALIGYSGNTGYSSGPHLHFSVVTVDQKDPSKPCTVAFEFKNGDEIIKNPKKGDRFTVK